MGRVLRRRRVKKKLSSLRSESEEAILDRLIAWMQSKNWSPTCNLVCHNFLETGRGLRALKDVKPNETIVKIPKNLLITTLNVSQSYIYHILINPQITDAQSVLAAFLVYEIHLGDESVWKPYLDSIPKSFSNPYFCSTKEKEQLPNYISEILNPQSVQIKSTYLTLMKAIRNAFEMQQSDEDSDLAQYLKKCRHCDKTYDKIITFSKYQWAYFVVNTRAVYIDHGEDQTSFRNNNLALAPFLDLFNHSFDASVQTGLIRDQTRAEFYQVITLKPFSQGSQVFINYGPHDNTKLYIEYGFFIPNNPLDEIIFDTSDINVCVTLSGAQCDFILDHRLNERMGFNSNGLNYNGKMALFVAVAKFRRKEEWLMKIYGDNLYDQELIDIFSLGKTILERRKRELINQLDKMKQLGKGSDSFKIASSLVEEHIRVLEYSFKNLTINSNV